MRGPVAHSGRLRLRARGGVGQADAAVHVGKRLDQDFDRLGRTADDVVGIVRVPDEPESAVGRRVGLEASNRRAVGRRAMVIVPGILRDVVRVDGRCLAVGERDPDRLRARRAV